MLDTMLLPWDNLAMVMPLGTELEIQQWMDAVFLTRQHFLGVYFRGQPGAALVRSNGSGLTSGCLSLG